MNFNTPDKELIFTFSKDLDNNWTTSVILVLICSGFNLISINFFIAFNPGAICDKPRPTDCIIVPALFKNNTCLRLIASYKLDIASLILFDNVFIVSSSNVDIILFASLIPFPNAFKPLPIPTNAKLPKAIAGDNTPAKPNNAPREATIALILP